MNYKGVMTRNSTNLIPVNAISIDSAKTTSIPQAFALKPEKMVDVSKIIANNAAWATNQVCKF
jgi:hypothetical protein